MKLKNNQQILEYREHTVEQGISVPLLHFRLLEEIEGIKHCFTTRGGGVSENEFSTMNFTTIRGDKEEAVLENYRRMAKVFGVETGQFVGTDQTHTTNVKKVTKADAGKGIIFPKDYKDIDGLITNEPGLVLSTFYADCVPLYFVDPVQKAIGLSHSGWRGTVQKMGQVTIEAMKKEYGSRPEDLYCAIGPSICQDCYEVSRDVAEAFMEAFAGRESEILWQKSEEKFQLDLWKANEIVLLEAGILPEHLAVTNLCTCCNPDILFSHRASKGKRGNLAAFLMLEG